MTSAFRRWWWSVRPQVRSATHHAPEITPWLLIYAVLDALLRALRLVPED